ncbi:C40 family peptidase [Sporichthya polymorpha]|uniref:C40 family peptidase n=1 Tax=Sporichthya polymorpha TaxID=35751 RepID=UPI00048FC959|nr:C40 family peptidase [Sporichthya polymorpha]
MIRRRRPRGLRPLLAAGAASAAAVVAVTGLTGSVRAEPQLDVAEARRQVEILYHQAEQATERYNDARISLREAEGNFDRTQRRAASQQAEVAALQSSVGAFAAAAYRNGGLDRTLQLVFADDPDAFLERATSLDALTTREAASLRKVVEARRELVADQTAAAQHLAAVEAQRKTLAVEKSQVEQKLRAAREVLNRLTARQQSQFDRASRSDPRTMLASLPIPETARAAKAVDFAIKQLGDRYVWAAAGPDAWDCSGLTMMAWREAGVSLPHSSRLQFQTGRKVSRAELIPGDLVYFYSPISHVAIYVGNGLMVDAPNPRDRVKIRPVTDMPWAGATRP